MATVVGVMDRYNWFDRTDVIVVVDPAHRTLTWVPRGLPCPHANFARQGWRILNAAFNGAFTQCTALGLREKQMAGHKNLLAALSAYGIRVQHSLVVARHGTEWLAQGVDVVVPVSRREIYWYPLKPTMDIHTQGRKRVVFNPPSERLRGERVHQWVGARVGGSDFGRLRRQRVLVGKLLDVGFPFRKIMEHPEWLSASDPGAYADLRAVGPRWETQLFMPSQSVLDSMAAQLGKKVTTKVVGNHRSVVVR